MNSKPFRDPIVSCRDRKAHDAHTYQHLVYGLSWCRGVTVTEARAGRLMETVQQRVALNEKRGWGRVVLIAENVVLAFVCLVSFDYGADLADRWAKKYKRK